MTNVTVGRDYVANNNIKQLEALKFEEHHKIKLYDNNQSKS